jgi:putative transcriptional regulator
MWCNSKYVVVYWMRMKDTVLNKVQKYRLLEHMTQEELAEVVGVSRQTIIAVEKGNYTPSVLLALRLASFFKQPVERLFTLK